LLERIIQFFVMLFLAVANPLLLCPGIEFELILMLDQAGQTGDAHHKTNDVTDDRQAPQPS
jgi:hypothetical protein